MGKKKKQPEAVSVDNSPSQETVKADKETAKVTYVVIRDGYRVEDREYDNPDDPTAIATKEFWTKVAKNHSWGEAVDIVQYDPKRHRIW